MTDLCDDEAQHSGRSAAETARLDRLAGYRILHSAPEPAFDEIAALAASLLEAPMAAIAFAGPGHFWLKAHFGMGGGEYDRSTSLCERALASDGVYSVVALTAEPEFASSSHVTGEPQLCFYAGVPLIDSGGYRLGTLSAMDHNPHAALTSIQRAALQSLARIIVDRLELRRLAANITEAEANEQVAFRLATAAHDRLREAIELLPEAIVFMDCDNRVILWNRRYVELYPEVAAILKPGIGYEEVLRTSLDSGLHPEDFDAGNVKSWMAKRLADHRDGKGSYEQKFRDGRFIRYDQRRTSDGGAICIRVDITEVKLREESFRLMFEHNPLPMLVCDLETLAFLDANDAAVSHYGWSKEQFLNMTALDIRPPQHRAEMEAHIRATKGYVAGERDSLHWKSDGSEFIAAVYSRPLDYCGRKATLATIIDVTQRKRHEQHIQYLAHHDALTGLANRTKFNDRLKLALTNAEARGSGFALLLIDLDHFKTVNDTLGHPVGDALIVAAADRLANCIRRSDAIARLGGDEFAVIVEPADDCNRIAALARRVIAAMAKPFSVSGHRININASIGITRAPHDGGDAAALLKNSDLALYSAKADGRGKFRFFEPQMELRLLAKRSLELDLRKALRDGEFVLHYQPLAAISDGTTIGFEALVRWNSKERGLVPPGEFIPVAEETGLIVPIGAWVLRRACMDAVTWQQPLTVAVNLSAEQFKAGMVVETVQQALAISGLAAHRLELEVTETVLLEKSDDTLIALRALRQLGAQIAMDDFGTGYSSLSYLQKFPFDKIKIDRTFVSGLGQSQNSTEIVRAVLAIGNSLKIRVSAEGIETAEQLAALRELGCQEGQGYYFGKPVPAAAISTSLKALNCRKAG